MGERASATRGTLTATDYVLALDLVNEAIGSLELHEVLGNVLAAMRGVVHFRGGSIALIEDGCLSVAASDPPVSPEVARIRLPLGKGLSGRVAATGVPIYSPDLDKDDRVDPSMRAAGSNAGMVSYFAVPVIAQGKIVGVLQVDAEEIDGFTPSQRGLIALMAPLIGAAIQNARTHATEVEIERQLQETEELRSDFISIVTHELRTPLTPVIGLADLIARGELPEPLDVQEFVDRIEHAIERLRFLVDELQHLALVDTGDLRIEMTGVHLAELARSTAESLPGGERISVTGDETEVFADPRHLRDVLAELMENALKFSGSSSAVEVLIEKREGRVSLAVLSKGKPLTGQSSDRLFTRFAQVERPLTRTTEGLGIGLALARALLERMGGTLEPAHEGTGFVLSLPAVEV